MKLSELQILNYRCFDEKTIIVDNYLSLVGANGSGKSTVLMALNVFFRNSEAPSDVINLDEEDFHNRNTGSPIEITVTFANLSDEAKEDLRAYVRQDKLVIKAKAEWDEEFRLARVNQYGIRYVIRDFAPYFEVYDSGGKAAELKQIFLELGEAYGDLRQETTKDGMHSALRDYEEAHPDLCEPVESENQFYGWSKGSNLLAKYCQWVYLPAIKDPTEEQDEQRNSALGKLLQRSIRTQIDFTESIGELQRDAREKYEALITAQNRVLDTIGDTIQTRLQDWAHPGAKVELNWHMDEKKAVTIAEPFARAKVGDGAFLGEIVRTGHGMQRSFLIALLQVLADIDGESRPRLILGFEEPELYQHPPQAKHLATLLEELSCQDSQIIITTHSPYFISSKGFENIRLFRMPEGDTATIVSQVTYPGLAEILSTALGVEPLPPTVTMAAIEQIMQPSLNEIYFCKVPILVEGTEDIAFISTYLNIKGMWSSFRRLGCHFIICGGKTNMSRPLAIANGLGLPAFSVFDGDCDRENTDQHERDNRCLLALLNEESDPMVDESFYGNRVVMWKTRILDIVRSEAGCEKWDEEENNVRDAHMFQSGVNRKNPLIITATLEKVLADGIQIQSLDTLCMNIIQYAGECG